MILLPMGYDYTETRHRVYRLLASSALKPVIETWHGVPAFSVLTPGSTIGFPIGKHKRLWVMTLKRWNWLLATTGYLLWSTTWHW